MTRDAVIVPCYNGVFVLPDEVFSRFRQIATSGMMYLRESEDMLTISSSRLPDGRRRQLKPRCRAFTFGRATRVAVVEVADQINVMPVEWRPERHHSEDGRQPA